MTIQIKNFYTKQYFSVVMVIMLNKVALSRECFFFNSDFEHSKG